MMKGEIVSIFISITKVNVKLISVAIEKKAFWLSTQSPINCLENVNYFLRG